MPNYNQDLRHNNTELDQILQTVNNLPEAGGGSGNYELIEKWTQTQLTQSWDKRTEPNGTPYNFSSVIVKVTSEKGFGSYGHIIVCSGGSSALQNRVGFITLGTRGHNFKIEVFSRNGIMDALGGYTPNYKNGLYSYETSLFADTYPRKSAPIDFINCYADKLPSGATANWEIWGIRR